MQCLSLITQSNDVGSFTKLLPQYNVALLDAKKPREKALKDSADYSAQKPKSALV